MLHIYPCFCRQLRQRIQSGKTDRQLQYADYKRNGSGPGILVMQADLNEHQKRTGFMEMMDDISCEKDGISTMMLVFKLYRFGRNESPDIFEVCAAVDVLMWIWSVLRMPLTVPRRADVVHLLSCRLRRNGA